MGCMTKNLETSAVENQNLTMQRPNKGLKKAASKGPVKQNSPANFRILVKQNTIHNAKVKWFTVDQNPERGPQLASKLLKAVKIVNSNFKAIMTMLIKNQTWMLKAQTLEDIPIILSITELLYNLAFLLSRRGMLHQRIVTNLKVTLLHEHPTQTGFPVQLGCRHYYDKCSGS